MVRIFPIIAHFIFVFGCLDDTTTGGSITDDISAPETSNTNLDDIGLDVTAELIGQGTSWPWMT